MPRLTGKYVNHNLEEPVTAVATAVATLTSVGAKQGWFGGGGEKGSGQTKPDTLAHAIDKLDKANDIEALNIAPKAAEIYIETGSLPEAQKYIDQQLGYRYSGPYGSDYPKWEYINNMMEKVKNEYEKENKSLITAGISPTMNYLFLGIGVFWLGTGAYYGYQKYLK